MTEIKPIKFSKFNSIMYKQIKGKEVYDEQLK